MSAEINLQGFDGLLKRVNNMGSQLAKVENLALTKAAEIVQQSASEKAPRSELEKEHLADNIEISKIKTKNGTKCIEVGITKADNSHFFYGKFLEWGTSKMQARPFMQPAFEENKDTVKAIIKETVMKGLNHEN
jgi:HK97 gp10 family phage protein